MLIPVYNPEVDDLEKSYLSNGYSPGVTTILVKNSDRFIANDRIMIGEQGHEKTEVVTVLSVSADGGTVVLAPATPTVFSHSADDPVTKLRFDQVRFYRSTTGINGAFSIISTQNLDVDNADLQTKYDDTLGLTGYYYYFTFYHSISGVESDVSDTISGGGWNRNQVGHIIDEILTEVNDPNENTISRTELLGYFNDVDDDLTTNQSKPFDFLKARVVFSRFANHNSIDFPTDSNGNQTMWKFERMDYNFIDSATNPVTNRTATIPVIPEIDFRQKYSDNTLDATTESDEVQEMCIDETMRRFRYAPGSLTATGAAFYLYYWKFFDVIESEGQTIETPTPKIYKLYAKAQYWRKRATTEPRYQTTADRWFADYGLEKQKYQITNRVDKGTPRSFRPASATMKRLRR